METFTKPLNLNGAELKKELENVGILVDEIIDFADGQIGFITEDKVKAAEIVKAHNGTITPTALTLEDKLASVGLNVEELKTALGL